MILLDKPHWNILRNILSASYIQIKSKLASSEEKSWQMIAVCFLLKSSNHDKNDLKQEMGTAGCRR